MIGQFDSQFKTISVYAREGFHRNLFVFIIRLSVKFATAEVGWNVLGTATR